MFRVLCFEYKIVSVPYFMDELEEYEIKDILENLLYTDKNGWEQTRLNVYATAQTHSKKKIAPTDVLEFPWEKENVDVSKGEETTITKSEIDRLKEKAKTLEKKLQNGE